MPRPGSRPYLLTEAGPDQLIVIRIWSAHRGLCFRTRGCREIIRPPGELPDNPVSTNIRMPATRPPSSRRAGANRARAPPSGRPPRQRQPQQDVRVRYQRGALPEGVRAVPGRNRAQAAHRGLVEMTMSRHASPMGFWAALISDRYSESRVPQSPISVPICPMQAVRLWFSWSFSVVLAKILWSPLFSRVWPRPHSAGHEKILSQHASPHFHTEPQTAETGGLCARGAKAIARRPDVRAGCKGVTGQLRLDPRCRRSAPLQSRQWK